MDWPIHHGIFLTLILARCGSGKVYVIMRYSFYPHSTVPSVDNNRFDCHVIKRLVKALVDNSRFGRRHRIISGCWDAGSSEPLFSVFSLLRYIGESSALSAPRVMVINFGASSRSCFSLKLLCLDILTSVPCALLSLKTQHHTPW